MNEKILVVDDEKEIADLLEVYLTNDNYAVYKFYNGTDALRCIEKTDIDLAILDVHYEWRVEPGEFEVLVGASSEDIRLKARFEVK